jgi:DNA-directed RNA polymerase sigma subunit (sigma70/sigma32)
MKKSKKVIVPLEPKRTTIDIMTEMKDRERIMGLIVSANLTEQENWVIKSLYGLFGTDRLTFAEIAGSENISVEQVMAIEALAVGKILAAAKREIK